MKKIMAITGWTKDDWKDHIFDGIIWVGGISFAIMILMLA